MATKFDQTQTRTPKSWNGMRNELQADAMMRPQGAESQRYVIDTGIGVLSSNKKRLPPIYEDAIAKLKSLTDLPKGWDSYSARPVLPANLPPALELVLVALEAGEEPRIAASSDGSVELYWENEQRFFNATVVAPRRYEVFFEDKATGDEVDPDGPISLLKAKQVLRRYLAV